MTLVLNQSFIFHNVSSSQWKATPCGTPGIFFKTGIPYLPLHGSSDMFTGFITYHNKTL